MKILLDECISRKALKLFDGFEVYTVPDMGFNGLKSGKLLVLAEKSSFDIFLTIDKNIDYQQEISKFQ